MSTTLLVDYKNSRVLPWTPDVSHTNTIEETSRADQRWMHRVYRSLCSRREVCSSHPLSTLRVTNVFVRRSLYGNRIDEGEFPVKSFYTHRTINLGLSQNNVLVKLKS